MAPSCGGPSETALSGSVKGRQEDGWYQGCPVQLSNPTIPGDTRARSIGGGAASCCMREVQRIDDLERLRLAVREELQAQAAMNDVMLNIPLLDRMASGVAAQVDYGFDVRWAPKWVKTGDAHRWTEDGEELVECLVCGRTTAHLPPAEADEWYADHRSQHDE
jgi:Zn ribbon nucleic-acid-binding protein